MNWRGKPLVDLATIVSLIGATTSTAGLRVRSELDDGVYPQGVAITDAQMARVHLKPHPFHGDWNYTIHPAGAQPSESVILSQALSGQRQAGIRQAGIGARAAPPADQSAARTALDGGSRYCPLEAASTRRLAAILMT